MMIMPLDRLRQFFDRLTADGPSAEQKALQLLLEEITTRLKYLCDVGIGYLTLDRPKPHPEWG